MKKVCLLTDLAHFQANNNMSGLALKIYLELLILPIDFDCPQTTKFNRSDLASVVCCAAVYSKAMRELATLGLIQKFVPGSYTKTRSSLEILPIPKDKELELV